MHRMFEAYPHAIARTTEIAARCLFSLDDLAYLYPHELVPPGQTPMEHLRDLTQQGLAWRYPNGVGPSVQHQVNHELAIIERLNFPAYFLTVHDTVRFARERNILCQGRGSAANSAVCYALGITVVDPAKSSLLFERFISDERGEPPDIDVDFEHERREEVIQYVYQKYGRHRAAMVCEIITYRRRSAVRDVGKALGLSLDQVDRLAKRLYWFDRPKTGARNAISATQLQEAGLDPTDHRVQLTVALTQQLVGLPRHVGVHVGGFTISDGPLVDLCPIEPATMNARTVIQWDKDDVDTVGFVKVDLLSLGMLTATRKCFDLIAQHWGRSLTLASVPSEDPAVYDMLCQADSIGVFQVESRAQMSMLPRLKPRCWYDLVIEVSIVRPGPIQGGMVHPYLRRRRGQERVTYAHPALRPILERTMGVPIFQEQVMAMAVAVGGFTPGQADALRRAMGAWRKRGGLEPLTHKLIHGMRKNGISPQYAEQICAQIQGFGEYGFPESHAASFARLVYISAWLKCHYPGAFAAALINSQPMGFYSARSLASDAERHGVEIRPVHVNHSEWDCTLEPIDTTKQQHALRLGFRLIKGLRKDHGIAITNARQDMPYTHIGALARRANLNRNTIALLARTGSLEGLHTHTTPLPHTPTTGNRRQALWAAQGLIDLPLFRGLMRDTVPAPLSPPGPVDNMREDYALVGLSVGTRSGIQDPVGLIRPELQERGFVTAAQIKAGQPNSVIKVGGVITNRQRPGTASGMLFMTLEDETGMINLVVRPQTFKRQRRHIMEHNMLEVTGRIQRDGASVSVLCFRFAPMRLAPQLHTKSRDFR